MSGLEEGFTTELEVVGHLWWKKRRVLFRYNGSLYSWKDYSMKPEDTPTIMCDAVKWRAGYANHV